MLRSEGRVYLVTLVPFSRQTWVVARSKEGPRLRNAPDRRRLGVCCGARGFSAEQTNSKTMCFHTDREHPSGQRLTVRSGQGRTSAARQC